MDKFKLKFNVRKEERGRSPVEDLSGESDSSLGSLVSVTSMEGSEGKTLRKRVRSREVPSRAASSMDSDDDADAPAVKVVAVPKRGRGRPPTTGEYVGLAKAKADLVAAQRQEMELRAEAEVEAMTATLRSQRSANARPSESPLGDTAVSATDLNKKVLDCVATITNVATKSNNLKGTFQRALKEAASTIREVVDDLQTRSSTEETKILQAANARLREEVAELRREIVELRKDMALASNSAPPQVSGSEIRRETRSAEELEQALLRQIGGMLNARFEALEGRLLPEQRTRPPLAADGRDKVSRKAPMVPIPDPGLPGTSDGTKPSSSARKGKKGKAKKDGQAASQGQQAPQSAPVAQGKESWASVAKKGKNKKGGPATSAPPQRKSQAKAGTRQSQAGGGESRHPAKARETTKLVVPRSAAVVLTLQPRAVEGGASYAAALMEAKRRINIVQLGIPELKVRCTASGSRLLAVPGTASGDKADLLAEKLREVFDESDLRIYRPTKCADLRITGLDDSVTKEEVAAVIARVGECENDLIKVGDIRRNAVGIGTTFVRCPVAAAKKVTKNGRVQVGWVSAQVKVLPSRPLRCYRCLEFGHVRDKCSEGNKDRSGECYRCGQTGHKASGCSAEPHCSACAAVGKPATHRSGGRACAVPRKKSGMAAVVAKAKKRPARTAPARTEESRMDAS